MIAKFRAAFWFRSFGVVCALGCGCASLQCNAAAPTSAAAQLPLRALAATCAACHGTDGAAVAGAATAQLAGLRKDIFVQRMREFRDGSRPSTVMQQIAKGFDADQTDALAAYFAASHQAR